MTRNIRLVATAVAVTAAVLAGDSLRAQAPADVQKAVEHIL